MRISSEPPPSSFAGIGNAVEVQGLSNIPRTLTDELSGATPNQAVGHESELQKTFQDFVGQTFFGQMIASMRSTQDEAAYFNGGRAEKIFQGQLDQVLAEELSDSSAAQFADPMFKLFQLHRQ